MSEENSTKTTDQLIKRYAIGILVFGFILYSSLGFPGFPRPQHDITLARGTVFLKTHVMGMSTTTNQVELAQGLVGKYPVGQQMIITYPLTTLNYSSLKMTGFQINTPGFKAVKFEPILPITAPSTGNTIVKIYVDTPSQQYSGPLDFTIYLDASMYSSDVQATDNTQLNPNGTWKQVDSFNGSGIVDTAKFKIQGSHWRINYTATGYSFLPQGLFQIYVMDNGGNLVLIAANTFTNGTTPFKGQNYCYVKGTFYLKINCTADWKITIEEFS